MSSKTVKNSSQRLRAIVVTSGKGGVGKSTTTANLGMALGLQGHQVVLIDADIGLRNLDLLLQLENRIVYTAMDVFNGDCRLEQALVKHPRCRNLALLTLSKNRDKFNINSQGMQNLIKDLKDCNYEFIFIDCPAGVDVGFVNAIAAAEEALIVTTPEVTAVRDADRVAGLLEANGLKKVSLLINRIQPDLIEQGKALSAGDIQDMLGLPLIGIISEDSEVSASVNLGQPVVLRKRSSLPGLCFENAARRFTGKQDFLIDLETPYKGLFKRTIERVQDFFLGSENTN